MPPITRAISIRQPFVEQILLGTKRHEYRTVPTNIRERVYIYAAAKPRTEPKFWKSMTKSFEQLSSKCIVGSVEIVDCKPHATEGYAYKLANPKRLRKPLIATNQPSPIFWRPVFAD